MKTPSTRKRKSLTASMVALIFVSVSALAADKVETAGSNQYEKTAIQVVLDWTAAFTAKDAAQIKSYMADNAVFRLDPSERTLNQGQEALQKTLDMILPAISGIKTLRIYAIGGPQEVVVISERIDDFTIGGKTMAVPVGGFFRVNPQTRKIEEWLDAPLIKIDLPPPPGAVPGNRPGNGPPVPR